MPELPEVETMVRGLRPAMAGRRVAAVEVHDPKLLQGIDAPGLVEKASGALIDGVDRRGKWVVFSLSADRGYIVIQPRMTGGFRLTAPARPDHVRLTFRMEGPHEFVWFCDNRRLGKIAWYVDSDAAEAAFAKSQGPDALEIAAADLSARLKATSRPVKPALMDQKLVAGIGNIYADVSLFRARVHPERKASSLSASELSRIHEAVGLILHEAIASEGSSFDAGYRTVLGLEGGFLAHNAMYGRGGQPCPGCGGPVTKTKIVGLIGRPTHFCPICQPVGRRRGRRV